MTEHTQGCADRAALLEKIGFLGDTLAPLFLEEPSVGEPTGMHAAMRSLDPAAAAAEWPCGDEADIEAALILMKRAVADGAEDDALLWEFRRLFVGPAAKAAPPWGSVYTDRECVVFGETTLALRQWMRAQGIASAGAEDAPKEPEDHIGLMLALMGWIADNKPEALNEYLAEHLLTWAPHFCDVMEEAAAQPFYEGLARLTRASLEGVRDEMGLQVQVPRFYR